VPALFVAVSAMTGGAVLRATGRIYFGLGERPESDNDSTSGSEEREEVSSLLSRVRVTMLAPIIVLLLGALAVGLVPGVHEAAEGAAGQFLDAPAYAREALRGVAVPLAPPAPVGNWTLTGVLLGLLSTALAVGLAGWALYGGRLQVLRRLGAGLDRGVDALRTVHSGHVGDYVAWLMVGVAALGAFIGLPLAR
jgi:multicomponent Na+:H+ antiporter subunit D